MATRCVICDAEIEPYYSHSKHEWEKHCQTCKEVEYQNHLFYLDVFAEEEEDDTDTPAVS